MNRIPQNQNGEENLKLLRARSRVYAKAERIMTAQLMLTLALPAVGGLVQLWSPAVAPFLAAIALVVIVLDVAYLDRQHRLLIRKAAKIGESFDCAVLEMPWDNFTAGGPVEAEDIHAAADSFGQKADGKLRDWYPLAVASVPLHLARIICQRTNLRYDAELRRKSGRSVLALAVVVTLFFFGLGLYQNATLTAWVITLAPVVPLVAWGIREYFRQSDTAVSGDALKDDVKSLWDEALAGGIDAEQCAVRSRQLQNAIYLRRADTPLVPPFLYRLHRPSLEGEMNAGAEAFIKEYVDRQRPVSGGRSSTAL